MHRGVRFSIVFAVIAVLGAGLWTARTVAQDATPVADVTIINLVERSGAMTDVDLGDEGPSAGDIRVWGPNALYDEGNTSDTGATSQGSCIALNADFDCLANETIVFADGSTLEIQGIQLGNAMPSTRTIVGGSGLYAGAAGTVSVAPTEDLKFWTKSIEIIND
jgi:hypothetical protein